MNHVRNRSWGIRWGVAATVGAVVLSVCAVPLATLAGAAKTSCPVNVLLEDNFSGSGSSNGTADLGGAKVAIADINKAGGVLGCPLKLTTVDDGSNYNTDLPLLEAAMSKTHFAMATNPDYAATSTAPYLAREGMLSIGSASAVGFAEPGAPYPLNFETSYLVAQTFGAVTSYALSKGYTKIAILTDNTAIGAADIEVADSLAKAAGATITDTETLDLSDVDFSSAVERAEASDPQVVLMDVYGTALGALENDIHTAGWNVPLISGQTSSATPLKGLVPASYLSGQLVVGPSTMSTPSTQQVGTFIKALKKIKTPITSFLWGYTQTYDAYIEFAWAANATHSLNSKVIAKKLHDSGKVNIPGLIGGPTGYTPTSGNWNAPDGIAIMNAGFFNLGRLHAIKYLSAPTLPASVYSSSSS